MMKCPGDEILVELAFALANREPPPAESQTVAEHVAVCDTCRQRLDRHLAVVVEAKRAFHAVPDEQPGPECLDNDTLAAYKDNALDSAARADAERHMAQCDHCLRQLVGLADIMEKMEIEDAAFQEEREAFSPLHYVVELARKGLQLIEHPVEGFVALQLEPIQVLGPSETSVVDTCAWTQILGENRFRVAVIREDAQHATLTIGRDTGVPPAGACVILRNNAGVLQSEPFAGMSCVSFRGLAPGLYHLNVVLPPEQPYTFTFTLQAQAKRQHFTRRAK